MPVEGKPQKVTSRSLMKKDSDVEGRFETIESEVSLPPSLRAKLAEHFSQIEHEFELLYSENVALQEKIEMLTERVDRLAGVKEEADGDSNDINPPSSSNTQLTRSANKKSSGAGIQISQRIKSTYKTSTNKIVSSFKTSPYSFRLKKEFRGHRDGVWEVSASRTEPFYIATASADHTARIWMASNGLCLAQYTGHKGSVNSIRPHPLQSDLLLTSSGDEKAHIWRANINASSILDTSFNAGKNRNSSEEDLDVSSEYDDAEGQIPTPEEKHEPITIQQPDLELVGHMGVVIASDWMWDGGHVITASWDHTANMYDAETGAIVNCFTGHDQALTNVSVHGSQKLVMTSSKDATFRLWDFRDPFMKVNVFQGHTRAVTTAVFAGGDCLVSGSDDRSIKVWDLKNLRSPTATIRMDSSVNRLSISSVSNLIAVPQDNGHLRLYDLSGNRQGRLNKISKGHTHLVSSAAWTEAPSCNLFTCGFDRKVLGWSVYQNTEK